MRIKKMLSLFMALIMTLTLLPANVFAADDPTSPTLTKTAEWIDQEAGLAKITLTAKGTPIDVTAKSGADVLLVLDASGSMDDHATEKCGGDLELKHYWFFGKHYYYECPECGATYDVDEVPSDLKCTQKVYMDESRWEIATDAVEALADEIIPDTSSKNRLGLVVFSSRDYYPNSNECDFTNDSDDILDEIPSSPEGGTNYTTGLQRAYDMLNARTDKSRPGYVVFLTDGAPGPYGQSGNNPNWNGENEIEDLKNDGIIIYTVGFNLTNGDATNRLENYATKSEYSYNITDGNELSGLFTNIGSTIESGVTVWDTIDSKYFTLANKPGTNVRYEASNGTVQCTGDAQFVWNLDNFSSDGETLEIYIQLKSEYMNKNKDYPTNKEDSAYGKYVGADGSKVDLMVSEENGSSSVPTLNVNKAIKVQFHFVGENQSKATFDVPAQANQTLESGNKVTRPNVTVAPGYKITDWYEAANCSGVPFDFSTPVTGNGTITLHARVDEDQNAKYAYQVEFYKNGAKSETKNGNVWAGAPSVTLGNAKAMKTGNYTNYSFTKAELGLNSYTQDEDVIAIGQEGNTVIKVYFTAGAVNLTFQRGDHGKFSASGDEDKTSVTKSTHFDASFNDAPGVTAELGWQPVGWYESGDADKNIVNFPQTITGEKTYVMEYEKNTGDWKSVTFYLNDGTSAQHKAVDNILVGSSVSDSDWPSNPDRIGYKFEGWFTKDGTDDDWGTQFTQSTKVNETINVYAKWERTKTDVPVHYYLGSTDGTELTFSQVQKIAGATVGSSYSSYINDALKEKGTFATNQDNYYEISSEKAIVYINNTLLETQIVNDGDMIQVVYPAKMGIFKVREYFSDSNPVAEQYLNEYEASLEHGSNLKYGAGKTDLTISEINKILDESLNTVRTSKPGAKIKSVSMEYQELNPSGAAVWQTPVTAELNATGTAVESFTGLDQLLIHGDCETRLTFEYELPIEIRVEYHKQYGDTDNYYEISGKDYVVGGGTNYVFKNDELNIVENANSPNNINKVVPAGVEGYRVVRIATENNPETPITTNKYKVTSSTTFIVYLDAITADGGKIVNIDNTGAPLEGGEFVFNQTNLSADSSHKNEYPISQDFVYGVEYNVEQTASTVGYDKVSDFKVKLKADGTGLELVGTVENVTVNGMTITVANKIDENQKFAYTVNRYVKGTETAVPGLPAITGESSLGNFTWTNQATTTTGYKIVTDTVQPTSLVITADATKNTANVYYEVDDSQTRSYKVTYWKEGEATPFDTLNNLTVLEADPMVAYESILMNNIPTGYELKGVEFGGNSFNPTEKVVITSTQHEIKVIYQKKDGMWFDVAFVAGDHGKLNSDQDKIEWSNVLKDTTVESLGGVPTVTAANNYEFIGWSTDGGATLIQNEDLPKTITQSATYTAQWTQIYNVKYYVYEKKNGADKTVTAKFDSKEEANAAVAAHIPHTSALYSGVLLSNQSKISNVDLAKFAVSTKPDKKDRTETDNAKFADLIRNYQNKEALNAVYTKAPGYDVVPFRLVLEGSVVHVDCYLVKNPEQWTTITFKAGDHGKWTDGTATDIVLNAIKGTAWSNYSSQVPASPVQNEIGWKLADGVWDNAILGDEDVIPVNGLVYTAQWVADNATVSFEIVGDKHGAVNPDDVSVQKGTKTTAPTVTADKGYQVVGWYTDDGCADAFDFSNTTITEDTKLYAKVVEKSEDWTTITFKVGDHGKWANDATEDIVLNAIKGTAWSNYSSQVPANPVQNEIGWKLADGVWDNAILGDDDVIPDNGLVYTAQWIADNATVSFEIVGDKHGAVNPDDVSVQKGTKTTAPTVTADKGYQVVGWYTDDGCADAFDFSNTTITEDTKLYAKVVEKAEDWTTITFKVGDHGKWANDATEDIVLNAIKGTAWSNYSSQVPANPVQNEIGWKLADGVWDNAILGDEDVIPVNGLVYTAQWIADNATVSFEIVGDNHGAVNPDDVSVQKGTKTTAPTVTADKGYQVVGWYTDDGCADAFDFSNTTITEDTKLYAKVVEKAEDWTTITFKVGDHGKWANDATEDIVLNAIKGTAWSNYSSQVPANPVQNEIGWKLADGVWDNAIFGDDDVIPDNGLVYTAVWTEDMADVTFQINGIMVGGAEQFFGVVKPDSQSIQKGKTAVDPTVTAAANIQPGYKFDGWFTDEECTNAFDFSNTISEDTVLYSKVSIKDEDWAKVTFKAGANGTINDGSGDVETIVTDPILIGNTIGRTIPSAKANTGYEFNAWYKVTEGQSGTEEVQETPKTDTLVEGDMTYLAKFSPLLSVNFIINTTKAAEGTTSPVAISGISNGTPWASIADQVPNVQGKLREGEYSHDYEFTGWNADFPETVTSNLTFNAEFDDIYTFVVEHADLNGGSYPNESIDYVKNEAGDAISCQANAPIRGYELTNITVYVGEDKQEVATTAELIQKLRDEYGITLTEDGNLSGTMPNDCIWIKYGYEKLAERTVAYVSDGTVKNMPENIIDQYKGDEIEISTQVPQRDGFDFDGWTVVDDTVAVTDGKFIMPDSDVKLKAEWTPNEEVWNFTVEHYLEGADTPFDTVTDSVLKREPNIESVALNAPQGYKFKEYQINGDPTDLPITISEDDNTLSVIYENNDLIVKHVYGDKTVYDTTQSKANVDAESVVVNAVNSGRYTRLRSVTVNGETVTPSRSITLDFSETGKNEVVFVYKKKKSDSGGTSDPGNSSDNGSDFGEEVTILDEEVPLADGLNVIDHFAYIFGYKDGTVRPTNRISREEVAAIFYRLLSDDVRANMKSTTQDFPDVSSQRWSNTSIATLSNGEVIAGYPNGEFRPGNSITRAEFAVIVSKFDNLSKADTNQFTDIENHWAKDFINSAALKGWISGYPDGTFHPNDYITRAEAMTLINSVLNRKVSKEGLLEDAKYWSDNSEDAWYYEAVMEATNSHDYTRETPTGDETWTAITPDKTWD